MKKSFILISFFCLLNFSTIAQFYGKSAKHIQGTFSLGTNCGISRNGQVFGIEFVEYFKQKQYGQYILELETGKIGTTDYKSYRISSSFQYNVFNINSIIFINLKAGVIAAYELQKNQFLEEIDKKLVAGAIGGLEIEFFLTNIFAITINGQQLSLINSKVGNFTSSATIGVRYSF